MDLQRLRIILKPETPHRIQYILPAYCLPFLQHTPLGSFGSDEGDEFGHAFLHALLGVFRDLRSRGD